MMYCDAMWYVLMGWCDVMWCVVMWCDVMMCDVRDVCVCVMCVMWMRACDDVWSAMNDVWCDVWCVVMWRDMMRVMCDVMCVWCVMCDVWWVMWCDVILRRWWEEEDKEEGHGMQSKTRTHTSESGGNNIGWDGTYGRMTLNARWASLAKRIIILDGAEHALVRTLNGRW